MGSTIDDENEPFLGSHRLRNDFLGRALYLLAFVEPADGDREKEYAIPYEDLEVRHLGELYENILEFNVTLADEDLVRRRTARGTEILLLSQTSRRAGDGLIRKGEVYFAETALERKQSGSYYTPESLVAFLNHKTITLPLTARFARHRDRFDEFLHEAAQAGDNGLRQGAFQSAVALLDHFIRDEVLTFTVCDPAMGSGHFLVNAANRITDFIISLLSELPSMEGVTAEITVQPNYWRRLVTRHCIYGVDRNPLSTHLAKLSLWLNCFARDHKLTFLDHHLRCGNSLIGVRTFADLTRPPLKNRERKKKNPAQLDLPTPTGLDEPLREATAMLAHIAQADEDDTDLMKESFEEAHATARDRLAALADLRTAFFMGEIMKPPEYGRLFRLLVENQGVAEFEDPELAEIWQRVEELRRYHHFFHWLLEFADIFGPEGSGGFDATVGNPPWDIVKPNSQEFFSAWLPDFRSLKKQPANRAAKELMAANPAIADKWQAYCDGFAEQSGYFREQENYQHLGKGDINTFKLFLEQFFHLLKSGGHQGIVVPSGLYTDKGCQPLRELFFEHSRIDCLYCFENKKAIFNIHRSFKFVLFCTRKGGRTEEFRCAFMQHDPARLPAIEAAALRMRVDQVRRFSPETLSVMEFNDQRDIDITARIYGDWPLLGEKIEGSWNVKFRSELHMTNDSHLFKSEPTPWPLYEGKMIWQFDAFYEQPRYWLDYDEAVAALGENGWEAGKYRVGFRDIGRSTDSRTLISSVLPPCFHGNKLPTVTPYLAEHLFPGPKKDEALLFTALFCSFCIDYIIRQKVSATLNYFYLYSLPVPRLCATAVSEQDPFYYAIVSRSARLTCTHESFADLWQSVFSENWTDPDFWYPPTAPIDTYGPRHEQEIRKRLREQAPSLTREWTPECGVHDRLLDRRDTGDRAQLRAEIDALIAHLYKLSRDDFSYILDTFPVLRRKEEKAFGEFMSRRKCLEEYDRIGQVLATR